MYVNLAKHWGLEEDWAKHFSGKSMRCGGVSAASGNSVRDGVLAGHGGWLQRESLRHYDLMMEGERTHVSDALNDRLGAIMESWRSHAELERPVGR